MISYRIIHHIPGRIRIEVPFIKKLSMSRLFKISKQLSTIPIPEGIKDIRPNPLSGSIVITYDHGKIDIIEYIKNLSCSIEIQQLARAKN